MNLYCFVRVFNYNVMSKSNNLKCMHALTAMHFLKVGKRPIENYNSSMERVWRS